MKGRESGMPEEAFWEGFFDPDAALDRLARRPGMAGDIVEFGCGYGTFTLPAARRTQGIVNALDIDPVMVARVRERAGSAGLANIEAIRRDFVAEGTGLASGSQSYAMIFNLLHLENPLALLREAHRLVRPGGVLAVIHWRSDIPTPRGPSLAIRPTPEQCRAWLGQAGFTAVEEASLHACCPWHYGLIARR